MCLWCRTCTMSSGMPRRMWFSSHSSVWSSVVSAGWPVGSVCCHVALGPVPSLSHVPHPGLHPSPCLSSRSPALHTFPIPSHILHSSQHSTSQSLLTSHISSQPRIPHPSSWALPTIPIPCCSPPVPVFPVPSLSPSRFSRAHPNPGFPGHTPSPSRISQSHPIPIFQGPSPSRFSQSLPGNVMSTSQFSVGTVFIQALWDMM